MWEFLLELLKKHGAVAVAFVVLIVAFGVAVRVLWKANKALQEQLNAEKQSHLEEVKAIVHEHAEQREQQQQECQARLKALSERLDELQERRVTEAQEVTEKVVNYIGNIDQAVAQMEQAIEFVIQAGRK